MWKPASFNSFASRRPTSISFCTQSSPRSSSLVAPTCGVAAGLGCVRLVRHGLVAAAERDPPQPAG
eukprot:829887-Heterocapsa_arctica.AAC.1